MGDSIFAYIWRYTIRPERAADFLAAYRADGDWARFFSRDPAYIRTDLLKDATRNDVYMTIDYWQSKTDRDRYRAANADEFNAIDKRCESYTVEEEFLGDYRVNDEQF